jgi:transposase
MDTVTRCYRYTLLPMPVQRAAIEAAAAEARQYWNGLVAVQRWAEREIRAGRQASLVIGYEQLLQAKALTGRAVSIARQRAALDWISLEAAISRLRAEKARELDAGVTGKNAKKIRWLSRRKLATEYAVERVERTRKIKGSALPAAVAYGLLQKFSDCTAEYVLGKRRRPRFKRRCDAISLQAQVTATTPSPLGPVRDGTAIDLSRIAGEVCGKVPLVFHRDLPPRAKIKQVAVTIRGERMYAVLMIEAPAAVLQKVFPAAEGRVAGIDPGRKIALALSTPDGGTTKMIQPALSRDTRFLRRLRRLQRKADRQRRAGNPECFGEEGRWIRGKRLTYRSGALAATEAQIEEMQSHIAAARLDFYHCAANELLTEYDAVAVGKWRGRGNSPGEGKARRAQNRKDYDHAISLFVGILKYKAGDAKQVTDEKEHGSTRDCANCGEPTGPTGLAGLKVRKWTCSNCGTTHENRDFAAAGAIARRAADKLAAGAQPRSSQSRLAGKTQRRRPPEGRTKVLRAASSEVPVNDEAGTARTAHPQTPSAASAAVPDQDERSASAPLSPVAHEDRNIDVSGHAQQPGKARGPLVECAVEDSG